MRIFILGLVLLFAISANAAANSYECGELIEPCSVDASTCSVTELINESRKLGFIKRFVIEQSSYLGEVGELGEIEQTYDFDPSSSSPAREIYSRESIVERVNIETGEKYSVSTRNLFEAKRKVPADFAFTDWVDGKNIFVAWHRFSSESDPLEHFWFCEELAE